MLIVQFWCNPSEPEKISLIQHASPRGSREESSGPALDSGHFCLTTRATPSEIYFSAGRSMSSLYLHWVVVLSAADLGRAASKRELPAHVGDRTVRGLVSSSMPAVRIRSRPYIIDSWSLAFPAVSHPFRFTCWLLYRPSQFTS